MSKLLKWIYIALNVLVIIIFLLSQNVAIELEYTGNADVSIAVAKDEWDYSLLDDTFQFDNITRYPQHSRERRMDLSKARDIQAVTLWLAPSDVDSSVSLFNIYIKYNHEVIKTLSPQNIVEQFTLLQNASCTGSDDNQATFSVGDDANISAGIFADMNLDAYSSIQHLFTRNLLILILVMGVCNILIIKFIFLHAGRRKFLADVFSTSTQSLYRNFKSYPVWNIVLFSVLVLVTVMAFTSGYYLHPDEDVSQKAVYYYQSHTAVPHVSDASISDTFCVYGKTRLSEMSLYYQASAIFSQPFWALGPIIQPRLFNIFLFFLMAVIAVCSKKKNVLSIILLLSPQIWYIFSYTTSDGLDFFLCFVLIWQLISENSWLNRYLRSPGVAGAKNIGYLIFLSLLTGMILLGKQYFYVVLLLALLYLLYRAFKSPREQRKNLFIKYALILMGAAAVFLIRYIQFEWVHGFEWHTLVNQACVEKESDFLATFPVHLKEKGFSVGRMFLEYPGWFESSFKSMFGTYGFMTLWNADAFYYVQWILFGCILGFGVAANKKVNMLQKTAFWDIFIFFLCSIIAVGLSIYNSWAMDYQPQGRYLLTIFLMSGLLIKNLDSTQNKKLKYLIGALALCLACINMYSFLSTGIAAI